MASRNHQVDRDALKRSLSDLGWSNQVLADKAGCSLRTVEEMTGKKGHKVSMEWVAKVAYLLGVEPAELLVPPPDQPAAATAATGNRVESPVAPKPVIIASRLEITVSADFAACTADEALAFAKQLHTLVSLHSEVVLKIASPANSIRYTVEVSPDDAERLLRAWRDGELRALGVTTCTPAKVPESLWDDVMSRYPVTSIVRVKAVSDKMAFGGHIRVELEPGLGGEYIDRRAGQPAIEVGSHFYCRVIRVAPDRGHLLFGPDLSGDPWHADIPRRYREDAPVRGVITAILPFAIRVELEPSVTGVLGFTEASPGWPKEYGHLAVGDAIEAFVKHVESDRKFVSLQESVPSPSPEPGLIRPLRPRVTGDSGDTGRGGSGDLK